MPFHAQKPARPPAFRLDPDRTKSWLGRLWPLVAAHRWLFGSSMILFLLGLAAQVLIPDLLNRAISQSIQSDERPLSDFVIAIVGLAVFAGVIGYFARYLQLATAYAMEYDLRNMVFEHLSTLSTTFFDSVRTGELISRANSDIRAVQTCLAMAPQVVIQCCMAVLAFIVMFTINPILAVVTMVTLPFTFLLGVRMGREMLPASWLTQSRLAKIATIVDETVSGDRVVKAFAAEQVQLDKLSLASYQTEWAYTKEADIRAKWTPLIQNLPNFGMIIVVAVGGYMSIAGTAGVGQILAFSAYLVMLQAPFTLLGLVLMAAQRASASSTRIFEILDTVPTVVDAPDADPIDSTDGCSLSFLNVGFAYSAGADDVISGLDLDVAPGETVAIVGATGAGKSTLGRLAARLYDVGDGSVRINGEDVRALRLQDVRRTVAIVGDDSYIFSSSIAENIAYARPDATQAEIETAARLSGADEFIVRMPQGYDTLVGERGVGLSGGQRQRLAIARIVLSNPSILILDDATSAIDVQLEATIFDSLRSLMSSRTTIIVAHRLSTIALADRVILLDRGRVVADGPHVALLERSPRYRQVVGADQKAA